MAPDKPPDWLYRRVPPCTDCWAQRAPCKQSFCYLVSVGLIRMNEGALCKEDSFFFFVGAERERESARGIGHGGCKAGRRDKVTSGWHGPIGQWQTKLSAKKKKKKNVAVMNWQGATYMLICGNWIIMIIPRRFISANQGREKCVCVCVLEGEKRERHDGALCFFDFCRLIFWPNHKHKLDWIVAFINFTYRRKDQNFWVSFKRVRKIWAWNLNEHHTGYGLLNFTNKYTVVRTENKQIVNICKIQQLALAAATSRKNGHCTLLDSKTLSSVERHTRGVLTEGSSPILVGSRVCVWFSAAGRLTRRWWRQSKHISATGSSLWEDHMLWVGLRGRGYGTEVAPDRRCHLG